MQPPVTGNFQWMKALNRSLVLNRIRTEGPISRADIAKRTSLTPATVTNLVQELLEDGFVVESDTGRSSGGRKPILLRIQPSAYQVIGIDVGVGQIKAALADLEAAPLALVTKALPAHPEPAAFLELLRDITEELLAQSDKPRSRIAGIGVGMHGVVDSKHGVSLFAPGLQLRNVPIRESLEAAFGIPVHVENDVAAMALGELWFGAGQDADHFICVNIGDGVGAGIILDRRLYRGSSFSAGEIGHTALELDGPLCVCGSRGCLQTFVSGPALANQARREIERGRSSLLGDARNASQTSITGQRVGEAARQGDSLALELLQQAGTRLGISLTNLIHTLNPQAILLCGGVAGSADLFLDSLKEAVRSRALEDSLRHLRIEVSPLLGSPVPVGAITIVLSRLFSPQTVLHSG